jgi:hypothetical protein
MKRTGILLLIVFFAACKKDLEVTSIDQIPGRWRWESTCGGAEFDCTYGTKTNYATIDFTSHGEYIEKHNGEIFLQTNYTILKDDELLGTLVLETPAENRPIAIMNNLLLITRGTYIDTYSKIK